ncbi:MAG: hypothetical protein GF411_06255 [Candidatus Lokiarchaeota archaeon]|nr:hypothetical protein [Candidatus Lokiarchaeota archaeon]
MLIAILFTIEGIAATSAYTVMTAILGTAYEGRAGEGFGTFEAIVEMARFLGPIVGGLAWI